MMDADTCRSAAVLAFTLLVAGCASGKGAEKKRASEVERPPTVEQIYRRADEMIPGDSTAVMVASGSELWEYVELYIPPVESEEVESGDPGTREAFRRDGSEVFRKRLGIDPLRIEAAVLGANQESGALVLFGTFEFGPPARPIEVDGRDAYRVEPKPGGYLAELQTARIFMAEVPGDPKGVVLAPSRSKLASTLRAVSGDGASRETLAGTERGDRFEELFEAAGSVRYAVASPVDEIPQAEAAGDDAPVPPPDGAVFGIGEYFRAVFQGPEETLDEFETQIASWLDKVESGARKEYEKYPDQGLLAALSSISSYHLTEAMLRRLEKRRSPEQLAYDIEVQTVRLGPMLVGASAAFALPLFESFIGRGTEKTEPESKSRSKSELKSELQGRDAELQVGRGAGGMGVRKSTDEESEGFGRVHGLGSVSKGESMRDLEVENDRLSTSEGCPREKIRAKLEENTMFFESCYAGALDPNEEPEGDGTVHWEYGPSGEVADARFEDHSLGVKSVGRCVRRYAYRLDVDVEDDEIAQCEASYRFEFRPAADSGADQEEEGDDAP